jgi:5-hydroxyisourate hydrolase-like protein (transthyretin family)
MNDQKPIIFRFFSLILLAFLCFAPALAQDPKSDDEDSETTFTVEPQVMVKSISATKPEEDESKVTGATVRGRLIYEDTNRPLRYAMITLVSDKESYSTYGVKFVKTDANGEFLFKNVKPGSYSAYVKSEGILNPESYKFSYRRMTKEEQAEIKTEKIEIGGLGDFQIVVAARRGAAVSGRIVYADGEAAVGVKVEVLRLDGRVYSNTSAAFGGGETGVGSVVADDRGAYRIAGLPEGQYIVRVVEPASHIESLPQPGYAYRSPQSSLFKTYYPEGDNSKNAKTLELTPGQELADINISLPERRLFEISGRVVKKAGGDPLAYFNVSFLRISDRDEQVAETTTRNSTTSNKAGEWKLTNLPAGKYRITVSQDYSYISQKDKNAAKKPEKYPNVAREIEISDKNLADLNFEMPGEASISGTIVVEGGKPFPQNTRLYAIFDGDRGGNFTNFDYEQFQGSVQPGAKEMSFRIGKLGEGNYRLVSFENRTYYVKSVMLGTRDLLSSPVEVKEGEEIKGVQVVLATNLGAIKGKVDGYDGRETVIVVAVDARAPFTPFQSRAFSGLVEPTGNFEIKAAPGEYSLVVMTMKNRPANESEAKEQFEKMVREGIKIRVTDTEVANVSLSMPK